MTLQQFHDLRHWHLRHVAHRPVEKQVWDAVLTLWVMAWVGLPAAVLIDLPWAETAGVLLLFLPGRYVGLRTALHRVGRLRCDWLVALR